MNKKNVASFIAGMAVMALVCAGIYSVQNNSGHSTTRLGERYEEIEDKLDTLDRTISKYYLNPDEVDLTKLEEGIYAGYVAGLEENYTTYYTAEDFAVVMESTSGSYSGIGAYVSQNMNTGIITIANPFEGGPAAEAGMQKEDILFSVEGEEVTGVYVSKVVARMKGEPGTSVNLTVYRASEDEYIDFTIERAVVDVPTVEYRMLDNQTGYIQITEFEEVTAGQFKTAVEDLKAQGMEKLIFDLRDNGGGLLTSVCDVLDTVLPKELLVYTIDKDGNKEESWARDDDKVEVPMAVLVNGNTASASEIFTGALKDYGVAEVIGTTTFGKGIVQSIIPFKDGSALKLTTAKYYTPSGVCIHGVGIEPDMVVEYDRESEDDNQLQAAMDYLNE
ncbi:MAG: S41 family peptidase [Clostridia bacterium]|nr:S41 family peptidase [Clostridia bacterium]